MLDDQNVLAQRDPSGALIYAGSQPEQLLHDFGLEDHDFEQEFTSVVFAGMGGSALAAEYARVFPKLEVPFVIEKGYDLPAFADESTLVICASYSGNTEETLSVLEQAHDKQLTVAVIASGGKLAQKAADYGYPIALLPAAPQPRTAVLYAYRALCEILIAAGLADDSLIELLESTVPELQQATAGWQPSVPETQNYAKQLAEKLLGKTLIIYGGAVTYPAAYKWKISANENAKNLAWCNVLPEFSHNEFIGWSSHPVEKPFAVIDLLSSYEHPRIRKRFELTDRLLSGRRPAAITIEAEGSNELAQILYLILLGDFTTTYLAILNGVDPTPVDLVEKFKQELA